jgi:hypothetical protein
MAGYESELTAFLRDLKKAHPEIEEQQKQGRALWWDRFPDAEDQQRYQASRVRRTSYVYYNIEPRSL